MVRKQGTVPQPLVAPCSTGCGDPTQRSAQISPEGKDWEESGAENLENTSINWDRRPWVSRGMGMAGHGRGCTAALRWLWPLL